MSTIAFYWDLFWGYIAQYAKGRMEYRWDFIVGLLSDVLYQSVAVIFLMVVFNQVPLLAGWSREEVFFIYGYFLWPYAIFGTLSGGVWHFTERYVVKGELDRILLRPANAFFQLILESIELEPLIGLVTGSAIMIWAGSAIGLDWRWYDALLLILLSLGSTLIYFGIYLPLASIGFWYDGRTGLLPLLWNVNQYGRYPIGIYNRVLRMLLTWIFPFAFIGFYPAAYFLRREQFQIWALLTPVLGAAFFGLAYLIWKAGLRRYHGTGS